MFPQLARLTDLSLLLLRLMVAAVFVTSGWSHVKDPKERAKSIGLSPSFTMFLGVAEIAGGFGSRVGCAHATRGDRPDSDHARSDSEENLRLAHGLLGGKVLRLALRPDAGP